MRRTIFVFLFGVVTGVAAIHVLEGPLDFGLLRDEASEVLDEAGRGASNLRLASTVRGALALHKDFSLFGGLDVDADAAVGLVTLRGRVATADLRQLAEFIAKGVDGVEEVANELEVGPEPDA